MGDFKCAQVSSVRGPREFCNGQPVRQCGLLSFSPRGWVCWLQSRGSIWPAGLTQAVLNKCWPLRQVYDVRNSSPTEVLFLQKDNKMQRTNKAPSVPDCQGSQPHKPKVQRPKGIFCVVKEQLEKDLGLISSFLEELPGIPIPVLDGHKLTTSD